MTKALIDFVTPWLVDNPDEIEVEEIAGEGRAAVVELSVHPDDVGKVIGRRGRIIRALRTLAKAAGQKENRPVTVEVID